MYPSLPKENVIMEVKRRIDSEDFITNCNKEALKQLAVLSVQFMSFKVDDSYYRQNDGLFIGSPASPAFAELFIQRIEEVSVYNMVYAPRIWLRKVDDTIVISHHNVEDMLKELNQINKKIKFTVEKMNDGMLPFLDCCLSIDGNKIKTKVYRKKTHTGQYNNFKSNQPLSVKKSTIKTLVKRAKVVCNDEKDLKTELDYIQKTMELNDFPKQLVEKTIEDTLSTERRELKKNDSKGNIEMYIPFERNISEKIKRKAETFGIETRFSRNKSLKSKLNVEGHISKDQNGVVYRIDCEKECGLHYIGETGRKLETRIKEHKADSSKDMTKEKMSGISQHAIQARHTPQWNEATILKVESNCVKRKYKEAICLIKDRGKTVNKKEEVKQLSSIWEPLLIVKK